MGLDGCSKCVKFSLFAVNVLLTVGGAVILGIALWVRFDDYFRQHFNEFKGSVTTLNLDTWYIALYVLMGVGGLLLLLGFLGCCGAACENTCLLGTYFAILLIVFLTELAAGIYVFIERDALKTQYNKWLKENFMDRYFDPTHPLSKEEHDRVDEMFAQYHCCGAHGCDDFKEPYPFSCNITNSNACPGATGCTAVTFPLEKFKARTVIMASVSLGILLVEFLCMVFAMVLCSAINKGSYGYY